MHWLIAKHDDNGETVTEQHVEADTLESAFALAVELWGSQVAARRAEPSTTALTSGMSKLIALGLTEDEARALGGL